MRLGGAQPDGGLLGAVRGLLGAVHGGGDELAGDGGDPVGGDLVDQFGGELQHGHVGLFGECGQLGGRLRRAAAQPFDEDAGGHLDQGPAGGVGPGAGELRAEVLHRGGEAGDRGGGRAGVGGPVVRGLALRSDRGGSGEGEGPRGMVRGLVVGLVHGGLLTRTGAGQLCPGFSARAVSWSLIRSIRSVASTGLVM